MSLSKNLNNSKKTPNDNIYTPERIVNRVLKQIDIDDGSKVLDGFRGDGAFYNKYKDTWIKTYCEIDEGKDFFEYTDKVDYMISNPPFSKLNDILNHLFDICEKGFGLILMATALTEPRLKRIYNAGFMLTKYDTFHVKEWFGFPVIFVMFEKTGKNILTQYEVKKD